MVENLSTSLETAIHAAPLLAIAIAFAAGVLTSFTPCVYPLIPITVGLIGVKGSVTKVRGFYLSFLYVIGLAMVYSSLGAFTALTGRLFGHIQTNPWIYLAVANICILFGLSMLEVFTINLPWLSRFASAGSRTQGGMAAFFLGGTSAFVAAPCTAPVLGILLTYVGTQQNITFGILMLFFYACGMGLLLLLIGTFTGVLTALPRSGIWMVRIKKGLGLLMVLVGEYFLIKSGQLMI